MKPFLAPFALLGWVLALAGCTVATQTSDPAFAPEIARPAFAAGSGPVVLIDAGHRNFHTADGRYRPFAELLRRDGYVVRPLAAPFTAEALAGAGVLVISNALSKENETRWKLPATSAFTDGEIAAVAKWVEEGGALFLIADHMPFPGSAEGLAAAFGVYFQNGFAGDAEGRFHLVFDRSSGTLGTHPITDGRDASERIESVKTFTGQAFRTGAAASPLLTMPAGSRIRLPSTAWKFSKKTAEVPADGLPQGAALEHGRGRIAVFGEAAMFSAQVNVTRKRTFPSGMNAPGAEQNAQLLLNVLHWLTRVPGLD